MFNEILWLVFALVNFIFVTMAYKLFGKKGLFAWIAVGTFIANVQVLKTVELFGMVATLGNIMYGTLFLVTDALSEKYSHKDAKKAVYLGFYVLVASTVIMQMALLFIPDVSDWANPHLLDLFLLFPRLVLGSLTAYIISQLLDVHLFRKIKSKLSDDKWLWVRNNGSTMVSQFVDTIIFVSIAFIGEFEWVVLRDIYITTYLIKLMVAALDTPFVYWIKKIKPLE